MKKADIGLIGLAVMGENLVMNMESKGFTVAVFNRTTEKVDKFLKLLFENEDDRKIYKERWESVKDNAIYKNIKGFKIPVESVVEKNNKLGVYVINEENSIPEFVSLGKNYYKDAKYYYKSII